MRCVLLALLLLSSGCGPGPQPPGPLQGTLRLSGSNTVFGVTVKLAEAHRTQVPGVEFRITADGTPRGIKFAGDGEITGLSAPLMSRTFELPVRAMAPTTNGEMVDIALSSRSLTTDEREAYTELQTFAFAVDGIAIAVNNNVTLSGLTVAQVRDIYLGTIRNWREVGGPDAAIYVITRDVQAGTARAFQELVLNGGTVVSSAQSVMQNEEMPREIAAHPHSIGYLSFATLNNTIRALRINNIEPVEGNVANETWPIRRPFLLITSGIPSPMERSFIEFCRSEMGAMIVRNEGYIPARMTP